MRIAKTIWLIAGSFFLLSFRFADPDAQIVWSEDYALTWEDFQGPAAPGSQMDAVSITSIRYRWYCTNDQQFRFRVKAVFDREASWVRPGASEKLLRHERLHFDITELHARLIRKAFSDLGNPCQMRRNEIEGLAEAIMSDWERMQADYDMETHHSNDPDAQKRWERDIRSRLRALSDYAN